MPAATRFSDHLNESDAVLWSIERDPSLRTTIVAIALLDRAPDVDRLRARLLEAADQVPRLRQRVVDTPWRLGPPRWVDDERFDIDYHLRRVGAPAPGDVRSILDIAGPIAMAAFDKDRPLWEFTLVEGLHDGGAALIQKVHHSFTDGVGGMALARLMVDDVPEPDAPTAETTSPSRPPRASGPAPSKVALTLETLADEARVAGGTSLRVGRRLPALSLAAVQHPAGVLTATTRTVQSVGKLLAPVSEPLSPVMRERGMSRRLDVFDVSLEQLLEAAHVAGGTLNDAFLAAVAGGMRRFHEHYGPVPEGLRVTMPVNLRAEDDALGNNRFTPVRFALPVTTVDPIERMEQIGALTRRWRREPALPLTELIAGALNRLPVGVTTSVFGSMLKSVDFVATNVPGFPGRTYLAGAEVLHEYAFAPPSGAAFSIALMSHRDRCCIGINADVTAVRDPALLSSSLHDGFDEVVAARTRRPRRAG